MPSHRRRSYSRDRSRTPSDRDRSRSRSPERKIALPAGADPISESDYFLKNDEFREWLREEKNKVRIGSCPLELCIGTVHEHHALVYD